MLLRVEPAFSGAKGEERANPIAPTMAKESLDRGEGGRRCSGWLGAGSVGQVQTPVDGGRNDRTFRLASGLGLIPRMKAQAVDSAINRRDDPDGILIIVSRFNPENRNWVFILC